MANRADWALLYKYPLFFAVAGFISGILLSEFYGHQWLIITVLSPLIGSIVLLERNLAFLFFIPLGVLFSEGSPDVNPADALRLARYEDRPASIEGVLYRSVEKRTEGSRLYLEADSLIVAGGARRPIRGKVVITSQKPVSGLLRGDRVRVVDPSLRPVLPEENKLLQPLYQRSTREGVLARGYIEGPQSVISFGRSARANPLLYRLERLRTGFARYVRENFPFVESELFLAVTVGDRGAIPRDVREGFARAGVAHLLAISGLHVAGVGALFYFLLKWLAGRSTYLLLRFLVPRIVALLTIIPLFLYMVIAGFATPVTRAFIMGSLFLVSIALGKQKNRLNILALSALIILLVRPYAVFEPSFQLSFLSVLGILFVNKITPLSAATLWDKVSSIAKTTVGATFATLPVAVNTFGMLPLLSVPSNLLFIPLLELVIVPLSMLSFLLWLVSPELAGVFIYPSILSIKVLLWGVSQVSGLGWATLAVPPFSLLAWAGYLISIFFFFLVGLRPKLMYFTPLALGVFILFLFPPGFLRGGSAKLEAHFLDLSSRRAAIVNVAGERTMVFDTGVPAWGSSGYVERRIVIPFLLENGITSIDYFFLTRNDARAMESLGHVMSRMDVRVLLSPGVRLDGRTWRRIYESGLGWMNIFGWNGAMVFDRGALNLLQPRRRAYDAHHGSAYPMMLKLGFGDVNMLMVSEGVSEEWYGELLSESREILDSDVLYIPEMDDSPLYSNLIEAVSPKLLVTSWGSPGRKRGLEGQRVYEVLEVAPVGVVTVSTDGSSLWVSED